MTGAPTALLVWTAVMCQAFLPLEIGVGRLDVPVADAAALALLCAWAGRESLRAWSEGLAAPFRGVRIGAIGALAAALVAWALVSALACPLPPGAPPGERLDRLHAWARWPLFDVLAYGVALRAAVAALGPGRVLPATGLWFSAVALISLGSSVYRVVGGGPTHIHDLSPLAENHKVLAQALAASVPWIWAWGELGGPPDRRGWARGWALLGTTAVLLSFSRTAALSLAVAGLAISPGAYRAGRARWLLGAAAVAGATFALAVLPGALGIARLADSTSTRTWLSRKALALVTAHPLTGVGPGGFVGWPGEGPPPSPVDAGLGPHGVVESLGAELGAPGLALGLLLLAAVVSGRVRAAGQGPLGRAAAASALALVTQLALSTETWTHTTWIPWALCLGLPRRAAPLPAGSAPATLASPARDAGPRPVPTAARGAPWTPS